MRASFTFIVLVLLGAPAFAGEVPQRACYRVEGMTCAACTVTLKAAVNKIKGVKTVHASIDDKSAIVEFDPKQTNAVEIKKSIDSTGYQATESQCHA